MSTNALSASIDPERMLAHFQSFPFDTEGRAYLEFHAKRYAYLIELIRQYLQAGQPCSRILDVGPSVFTQYMRDKAVAEHIDSLGYEDARFACRPGDCHTEYDLTKTVDHGSWPHMQACDIIIMAEVIEHLPIPPDHVLAFLSSILKPSGVLIIQTPNACSLPKRLRMLRGQNPFEMIRDCPRNPGHYREYTVHELVDIAQQASLTVDSVSVSNYFLRNTVSARVFRWLGPLFPSTLRDGITLCLRKQTED